MFILSYPWPQLHRVSSLHQSGNPATAAQNTTQQLHSALLMASSFAPSLWEPGKGKCKVHPRTGHEGPEGEQRYSSTLSLTSAIDGVGGQRHAPAAFLPGKTRYHCTGGGLGPRAGLDRWGKSRPHKGVRFPDRPARSESLYRLRYPGPLMRTRPWLSTHKKWRNMLPADVTMTGLCFSRHCTLYFYLQTTKNKMNLPRRNWEWLENWFSRFFTA